MADSVVCNPGPSRAAVLASRRRPSHARTSAVGVSAGSDARYDRGRDLPGLLALWPWEIDDPSAEGRRRLLALLRRALRLERQRGIAGHWTYDLARHARLLAAYRSELVRSRTQPGPAGGPVRRRPSGPEPGA